MHHVPNMSFLPFLGKPTANVSTVRVTSKQGSTAAPLPQSTSVTAGSTDTQPQTSEMVPVGRGQNNSQSKTTILQVTTTSVTTQEVVRTSSNATNQLNKSAHLGQNTTSTTVQSLRTGKRQRSGAQ